MTRVSGLDAVGTAFPARPRMTAPGTLFSPMPETGSCALSQAEVAATAPATLAGLLALQEHSASRARDRAARRRGEDLLALLAALHHALLAGTSASELLHQLAALTKGAPLAADPHLAGVVAALVLRARIEIARRQDDSITI